MPRLSNPVGSEGGGLPSGNTLGDLLVGTSNDGEGEWKAVADAGVAAAGHDHDADYAAINHTHDSRYYTETEIDGIQAQTKGCVVHGDNASAARPAGFASVEWVGSVEPDNAVDGDTWVEVAEA